jgi:hypothetical protein
MPVHLRLTSVAGDAVYDTLPGWGGGPVCNLGLQNGFDTGHLMYLAALPKSITCDATYLYVSLAGSVSVPRSLYELISGRRPLQCSP